MSQGGTQPIIATQGIQLLSTVTGVDMKTTGLTTLYTVPTGKILIATDVIVRSTDSVSVSASESLSIGVSPNYNELINTSFSYGETGYYFSIQRGDPSSFGGGSGGMRIFTADEVLKINVTVGATATTNIASFDLFGYLLDA
jgi:hypothetical protein